GKLRCPGRPEVTTSPKLRRGAAQADAGPRGLASRGAKPGETLSCEHILTVVTNSAIAIAADRGPDGLAPGYADWVQLRGGVGRGHIGCCDSSPRRHASAHFAATSHPVMRSLEPGETWKWCYVDETIG